MLRTVWRALVTVGVALAIATGSAAREEPKPGTTAWFQSTLAGVGACVALYAYRAGEEPNSQRGKAAQAAVNKLLPTLSALDKRTMAQVTEDALLKGQGVRQALLNNSGKGWVLDGEDVPRFIAECDKAWNLEVNNAWEPRVNEDPVWNAKAQLVCATFYQRATVKAQMQAGRNEAARAADTEIRRYARQMDRTYPETAAIVRKNIADFEIALKDGRITESKILETITMCDNHFSYYVADNYSPPQPFDCTGAYNAAIVQGNELNRKFERADSAANAAYYSGMRCGALKEGWRRLSANSCPSNLTGELDRLVKDELEVLDKANSLSDAEDTYQCSLTP